MKSKLILTSPILLKGLDLAKIAAAVNNSAAELERDVKENIQASTPAGKTYRRSAIVRRSTRRQAGLNLGRRGSRAIVGYTFHRASREGQPPAILTGRLLNSIRALRVGPRKARVIVGVEYGGPLDAKDGLNRPFFISRAELYRPRFLRNIKAAAFGR